MVRLTPLEIDDAQLLARDFALGEPQSFNSIDAGTINSNYSLETGRGRFFLRVNEGKSEKDVRYEAELLRALVSGGVPAPPPLLSSTGDAFGRYHGRCISLFPWVEGGHLGPEQIDTSAVGSVGEALALLHEVGRPLAERFARDGIYTWPLMCERFEAFRRRGDAQLERAVTVLGEEIEWQAGRVAARDAAPRGIIHGDLFPDNVMFSPQGELTLIDFEQASVGSLVYDLAVSINAWCYRDQFDLGLARAMVAGYQRRRTLSAAENALLYTELRASAARFTITRITDVYLRGVDLAGKDFRRYLARLESWRALGDFTASG